MTKNILHSNQTGYSSIFIHDYSNLHSVFLKIMQKTIDCFSFRNKVRPDQHFFDACLPALPGGAQQITGKEYTGDIITIIRVNGYPFVTLFDHRGNYLLHGHIDGKTKHVHTGYHNI